jgi:carbamoyltransferase
MAKPTIALYEGHDTNLTVYDPDTNQFFIYELEKISGIKHHNVKETVQIPISANGSYVQTCLSHLEDVYGIENDFEKLIHKPLFDSVSYIDRTVIIYDSWCFPIIDHHAGHSWSAYAQSPFNNAVCLSYDGWGDTTAFRYTRFEDGQATNSDSSTHMISMIYTLVGQSLAILHETYGLDLAGKVMGLSAYGDYDRAQIDTFKEAMTSEWWYHNSVGLLTDESEHPSAFLRRMLGDAIQADNIGDKLTNLEAYTLAKSVQIAFEETIIEIFEEVYLEDTMTMDGNLILTGGSALNVLANEAIRRKYPDINVFVPPNPSDAGISFGLLYEYLGLTEKYDVTLNGPRIFDYDFVPDIVSAGGGRKVTTEEIADMLNDNKIIGMVKGRGEVGPRALGNRSILSNAHNPKMKEILNARVKFREWFRPFAPMCRLEDASTYFYSPDFSAMTNMQFVADVLPEYQSELASITHFDNTARLQVVTQESNAVIHDILSHFGGVLINTSFNVQGKPILNTAVDALHTLNEIGLHAIVIEYESELWLIEKRILTDDELQSIGEDEEVNPE